MTFDLTIKAGDIILTIQTVAIIAGFYFSVRTLSDTKSSIRIASDNLNTATRSLQETTANNQAQLYNQMVIQGRDLVYKHMEIYYSGDTEEAKRERQKLYIGSVLSYYAACFGMRSILSLPKSITKLLDAELKDLMREEVVRKRYEELKSGFSTEFVQYVVNNTGV
jgi:hypothetical protein